jgi:hypothetical protein
MAELTETSRPVGSLLEPEDDSGADSRATMMVAAASRLARKHDPARRKKQLPRCIGSSANSELY